MRLLQLNVRRPKPLPVAGALARPAWWGPEEDAAVRAARRGCLAGEHNCDRCKRGLCPEALRVCRICAKWHSARGRIGACEHGQPKRTLATESCNQWRGRE